MDDIVAALAREAGEMLKNKRKRKPTKAESFNDPVALKANWEAKKYNSTGSDVVIFKQSFFNPHKAKLAISNVHIFICMLFMILGIAGILLSLWLWLFVNREFNFGYIVGIFIGTIFLIAGFLVFVFNLIPITFDKRTGYCWKGWQAPRYNQSENKKYLCDIEQIHAVQLLKDCNFSTEKPGVGFVNFELNLVLKDANVIRLKNYSNKKIFDDNAKALAKFLNVPVWDAT